MEQQIISTYTTTQAIDDGFLYKVADLSGGKQYLATVGICSDFTYQEMIEIWKEFWNWKVNMEHKLAEEERMFVVEKKGKKIWVVEDWNFTVMYPDEY